MIYHSRDCARRVALLSSGERNGRRKNPRRFARVPVLALLRLASARPSRREKRRRDGCSRLPARAIDSKTPGSVRKDAPRARGTLFSRGIESAVDRATEARNLAAVRAYTKCEKKRDNYNKAASRKGDRAVHTYRCFRWSRGDANIRSLVTLSRARYVLSRGNLIRP